MPNLDAPLLSYKVFFEQNSQEGDVQTLYEKYKQKHDERQAEIFFDQHLKESWFREKYNPELVYKWSLEK